MRETLAASDWSRVFREAAALGVVHVGLSGGEPTARPDLPEIVAAAAEAPLYTHLVTSGLPVRARGLAELVRAGLRSVQLSIQDADPAAADVVAGAAAFADKLAFAEAVRKADLPLTLNVPLHRANLGRAREIIELAVELGAQRLELATLQMHGWALANREALLPSRRQLAEAERVVAEARRRLSRPEILFVLPDYYADRPKPCMGGWGRRTLVVAPDGRVLPCQGAGELPGLRFWNVREAPLADCWHGAPGMNAFRGEAWMREPCRSCPERSRDFGGCRCQAFALTGEAANTDPACALAPRHEVVRAARRGAAGGAPRPLRLRGAPPPPRRA